MPGILDAEMPWFAKLMSLLMSSIPELGMGSGYHRAPSRGAQDSFATSNELQDIMSKAQKEETTADPRFNPWMMRNIPDWIIPQDPTYAQRLYPHMGGQLGGAMRRGPGEYGVQDIRALFGALQDPYVHKGIPRRHEPLRVVSPDVTAAQERARTGREEVAGILKQHGIGTSLEAMKALQGVFGQEGMKTIAPSMYPEDTGAPEPTADMRNWQALLERHRQAIGQEEQATGVPQSPEAIQQMAWDKAYGQKYGEEEPEEAQIPSPPSLAALDKMIEDAETVGAKRNAQMLRSKLMRAQLEEQGLPYDTSEEDGMLAQLRGKRVDWVKMEAENPDLKWGYIWGQLGTQ